MILFCDDELFNIELERRSIRSAVREAKTDSELLAELGGLAIMAIYLNIN